MNKECVHFTIGELLGQHLLDISQTALSNGDVKKAIDTYTMSFHGFNEEYVVRLLKNEAVIMTNEDHETVTMTDDPEEIEKNKRWILNWDNILSDRLSHIKSLAYANRDAKRKLLDLGYAHANDIDIHKVIESELDNVDKSSLGTHNLLAKILAYGEDHAFDNGLLDNGLRSWESMKHDVESQTTLLKYKKVFYHIWRYADSAHKLADIYFKFGDLYQFLDKNGMCKKIPKIEEIIENVLQILYEFCDQKTSYHHHMCDEEIERFKKETLEKLHNTNYAIEYEENGILKKDILDGYDAGWLSPEGEFYGMDGDRSDMIHALLEDMLFLKRFSKKDLEIGESAEFYLEKKGWMKIHGDEAYGLFIGKMSDSEFKYCPTKKQIEAICQYADKFYKGNLYTEGSIFGQRRYHPDLVSAYKLRQMDDIALHNQFRN